MKLPVNLQHFYKNKLGITIDTVDHPMGGGEGKASGGHPRSKNGIPAKGFKTRSKKKPSNKYIIERREKK